MPSIINSDDGVVSGTSGLKSTGGNDGITAFQQNGTERMRIDSSGNVGIGTSSPNRKLEISGGSTADSAIIRSSNSVDATYYREFGRNNSSGAFEIRRAQGGAATTDFTIDTSGNTKFSGNIGIGGTAPTTSGTGITFPATQSASTDANTLDDYEEGTFDVTVTMGTSGTCTVEPTYNKMRYTKIGQMVTIQGQVLIASVSSPVGEMRMSLPFSIGNADEGSNLSGCVPRLFDVAKPASGIYPYVYVLNGNNYMVMSWVTDNSATINHVPAAGDYFIINFSYFI